MTNKGKQKKYLYISVFLDTPKFISTIMKKILIVGVLGIIAFMACKHEPDVTIIGNKPIVETPCDSAGNILYATQIKPIFDVNCTGCHSAASPSGGVSTSDSASIVLWHKAGRMIGSIRHLAGFSAMPKGGNSLTECQIRTIEIWLKPIVVAPPIEVNNCSPDSVYYANVIQPLLTSSCGSVGCHSGTNPKEGVSLTSYAATMRWVKAGNANSSKVYAYANYPVTGQDAMPPSGAAMSSANVALLAKWINQGAKNNTCIAACDTSNVTFSTSVKPIIDLNCLGCHGASGGAGGVSLNSYANISANATRVVIRMRDAAAPMPTSGLLPECKPRTIELWINAGKPNN